QRVGFAGPPGSGKSSALRMLVASQAPDTAVVFAALRPRASLEKELAAAGLAPTGGAPKLVLHTDPHSATPAERYLLVLTAFRVAHELTRSHRHVLLALDDLTGFAEAAAELTAGASSGALPLPAAQVVAALLDAAGNLEVAGGRQQALSVAAVFDLDPEDELPPLPRELWRTAEPSLDVCLNFSARLAAGGVLPAIHADQLLAGSHSPRYQAPLLRALRSEFQALLLRSRELQERLEMGKQLGLHAELQDFRPTPHHAALTRLRPVFSAMRDGRALPERRLVDRKPVLPLSPSSFASLRSATFAHFEDVEELGSAVVARALLAHSVPRTPRELAVRRLIVFFSSSLRSKYHQPRLEALHETKAHNVLVCSSVVFYFPRTRPPSRTEVAKFQARIQGVKESESESESESRRVRWGGGLGEGGGVGGTSGNSIRGRWARAAESRRMAWIGSDGASRVTDSPPRFKSRATSLSPFRSKGHVKESRCADLSPCAESEAPAVDLIPRSQTDAYAAVLKSISTSHPDLWEALGSSCESAPTSAESAETALETTELDGRLLRHLGEALLAHRFEFELTRPGEL
ncbi:unnamed protein product, partial [Polarella glacialis]